MVITASDSNDTLISLEPFHNKKEQLSLLVSLPVPTSLSITPRWIQTSLHVPEVSNDSASSNSSDDDSSFYSCSSQRVLSQRPLFLLENISIDEALSRVPPILARCKEFLQSEYQIYESTTKARYIYVGQGEIAHAVPLQCEVLVTDKSTTCHCLAIRSESDSAMPLTSLTHLDATTYASCLEKVIQHHKEHHLRKAPQPQQSLIQMELHIVGGFNDDKSRELSNWLIPLLAQLAAQQAQYIHMTVQTCVVSSMNDYNHTPSARGLAIDVRTGDVFPATCPEEGPSAALRAARLWSPSASRGLYCIHHERCNTITLQPFHFTQLPQADWLLALRDEDLLHCTSTSPAQEDSSFCMQVRHTLHYLNTTSSKDLFGLNCDRPIHYKRIGRTNQWKQF